MNVNPVGIGAVRIFYPILVCTGKVRKRGTSVNLINERVEHRVFGSGSVISVEQDQITVQFAEKIGQKKFSYPSAFEQYLKLCDENAQEFVSGEMKVLTERVLEERSKREQEFLAELAREAEEKKAARKTTAKTKASEKAKEKTSETTKKKTAKTVKSAKA